MCGWVDYKLWALSSGAHFGSDFLNSCMINKPFFVERKEASVLITALLQELSSMEPERLGTGEEIFFAMNMKSSNYLPMGWFVVKRLWKQGEFSEKEFIVLEGCGVQHQVTASLAGAVKEFLSPDPCHCSSAGNCSLLCSS